MNLKSALRKPLMLVLCLFGCTSVSEAKLLQVGIEHSETLAPVPNELRPGQHFHKRNPVSTDADRWAVIPVNTAGQWRLVRKFDVSSVDLRTGERVQQKSDKYVNSVTYIGYQIDNEGRIWTSADIESKIPHSDGSYLIPASWELKRTSDHSFTVIKRGVSINIDLRSHMIRETRQLETFAIFDVVGPNRLVQKYSTQWFEANGEAIKLTEGQTEMERIAAFEPVDELNGIDIKSSFKQFLRQ